MASFHKIVEAQRDFFRCGATLKLEYRKQQLKVLKKLIIEEQNVLSDAVYKDLRRIPKITYGMELGFVLIEIDYVLNNLDEWASNETVGKTLITAIDTPMIVKEPLGVVLIISPWNYPLCLVLAPLVGAIAAGNTAIIKTSEKAPNTGVALADVFAKYFDPQFLTVLNGDALDSANLLKERFDHIFFTGGTEIGKIIMTAAAQHLTPVTLELGGKCPVFVENDADIEITARRIAWGKWINCGQTCLSPNYILTTTTVKNQLLEALKKNLHQFYGTDPQCSPDYSRVIDTNSFDRLQELLKKSQGTILHQQGELDRDDLFIPPIILDVTKDDCLMEIEIFGPILPIVTVRNVDEAIDFVNSHEKPLSIYIFTRNESKIRRICSETSSGGVVVNDVCLQMIVDTLPFGGVGYSGMGRYRGKFGFDTFTHEKAVLKRGFFGDALFSMRYPPMTDNKFANMNILLGKRLALPRWFKSLAYSIPVFLLGSIVGFCSQRFLYGYILSLQ